MTGEDRHGRRPRPNNSVSNLECGANGAAFKAPSTLRSAGALHKYWPHAPLHRLSKSGTYFVTSGTYLKRHYFKNREALDLLCGKLLEITKGYSWTLEAWAVFSNHYHFIAHSPEEEQNAQSLSQMVGLLHEKAAKWANKRDNAAGRKVWHNFFETRLTYFNSYLARLNYVHQNPVKHGLVKVANHYPWCSAAWFERSATTAQVKTIYGFKTDKIKVFDDY